MRYCKPYKVSGLGAELELEGARRELPQPAVPLLQPLPGISLRFGKEDARHHHSAESLGRIFARNVNEILQGYKPTSDFQERLLMRWIPASRPGVLGKPNTGTQRVCLL